MDRAEAEFIRLAETKQHSVATRAQARSLGVSRKVVRARLDEGIWAAPTPRVLRVSGAAATDQQRCMAAVLDAGGQAVVSHTTAAALWGLPGFTATELHVSRARDGTTSRTTTLARLHEVRALPAHHSTVRDGIPMTTVARTVFDLAGVIHPDRADRAVDNALTRRMTTVPALRAVVAELADHGRGGSAVMNDLLAKRADDYVPPASGLEASFAFVVQLAGLPEPRRQFDAGAEAWVGRVDYAWPGRRLLVEIDSDLHHSGTLDREADRRRDAALRAAGFFVLRFTEQELADPHRAAARLLKAWNALGAKLQGAILGPEA